MRPKAIPAAAEGLGAKGFINRFSIGRRLALGFVGIFVLLLAVNGILLWQFYSAQVRADRRLTGVSLELIAALNLQSSLQSFDDRLDRVAQSQDAVLLRQESGSLRDMILDGVQDARNAITHLPPEVRLYPTFVPTIEVIESTLPSQLESLNSLAASGDWSALRQRLANEKQPLDAETSMLVKSITRELNDELGQTVTNIARLERQMVIVLPLTALGTLLIASLLGVMITRSITTPLGKLMEGSSALSRGEFDQLVPVSGDDELARLGRVFNDTAGKLRSLYETLQDSKAKLEEAQRIAHVGYWEWDLLTDRVNWSDETYRIYGLQPQEYPIDIAVIRRMIHPDDLEFVFRVAEEALRGGLRTDVEHRIIRPSGKLRTVHSQGDLKKDASGRPCQMFGTVQDITDRKRAEETLQQSQFHIAEGQRLAHMGSWAFNPTGFTYWSSELFQVYGLDPHGKPPTVEEYLALVHPEDRAFMKQGIAKMLDDHLAFDFTKRIVRPDGEIRRIRCVGIPVTQGGTFQGFLGTGMDVTDQERLTEELRLSERYLSEGQRLAHMGSWAFNPSGFFEHWSQELFKIYGLDPQKGAPTLEQYLATMHPQDRDFMADTIKRMHAERSGCDVTKRIVRPDGELRYIRCVGIPVVEGEVLKGFLGTAIDVTEQELLTQELERRQAHLTEAQKLTHTGSWVWRVPDWKAVHLSEEWYRIYGFDPAEAPPTSEEYLERVHPEDRLEWKGIVERAIVEKADYDQEFRILLPNGMVKWIHTVGHPVLSDAGDLEQFVGSSTDITELKSAEQGREKLRQLEADLAHIDRVSTLGEMAASLAHEIKQPIAAAITSANSCIEWLAHEPPNLDRARAAAARIDKYGNRAAEIIDRIRSFYRKSPSKRELVDVNGIVHEMLTLLKGEANRSSVAMNTELASELPTIMVDRVQLQQVFMNLMLNAIEAMKDSGGDLTVRSELQDGQLQFSVSDTGVGLPMEKMDQIFSAFFTTKPQGSGMGLAISRSIVESHGGRLWATANGGRGATFHFTLPTEAAEPTHLVA
jgi:PAS domain S-box-containing protein